MSIITHAERARLRAVAEAATPGEWHSMANGFSKAGQYRYPTVYSAADELRYIAYCNDRLSVVPTDNIANAAHIAAFSPATALALLDRCADMEKNLRILADYLTHKLGECPPGAICDGGECKLCWMAWADATRVDAEIEGPDE